MTRIELKSRVGADGTLTLVVPLGTAEANREVRVTVERIEEGPRRTNSDATEWRERISKSIGTITDPTFRRHPQGEYEEREPLP